MTDQLEQELIRTMTGAGSFLPPPDEDILVAVRRRQRQRRQRRVVSAAACAVALIIVGGLTAVRLSEPAPNAVTASTWAGGVPDFGRVGSPEQVWPKAVRRLPGKLPNGDQYTVQAVLGKDRYLVNTSQTASLSDNADLVVNVGSATAPSIFDVKAGTVRLLGDPGAATAPGVDFYSLGESTVVGDQAVWMVSVTRDNQGLTELWSAPVNSQGAPRLLLTLTDADRALPHFSVAGNTVYWHQDRSAGGLPAGIYRIPVTGGTPTLVPGSEEFHPIALSPWVNTMARETPVDGEPSSGELWNLVTGERRAWTPNQAIRFFACDPVLCTGRSADDRFAVQRLDGAGYQELPYEADRGLPAVSMSPAFEGRFGTGSAVIDSVRTPFIWDRFTGKAAVVKTSFDVPEASGSPDVFRLVTPRRMLAGGFEDSVLQWSDGKGGFYLLDLLAIK